MRKTTSEDIKKRLLEGNFSYEALQLFYCMLEVRKTNPDESKISIPNYIAVAFSTHARNLWEFFYAPNKYPSKNPRANHYIKNWNIPPSPEIKRWKGMIDKKLSHLDYDRGRTKGLPPVAYIYSAYRHFRTLIVMFLEKLPERFFGPNLRKLKGVMIIDSSANP